jgi:hypothetical protein
MKVRELFGQLMNMDPNAEVLMVTRAGWPTPLAVTALKTRGELLDAMEADDDATTPDLAVVEVLFGGSTADVFLMEESGR